MKKGFTLVELLAVIAIIGIIGVITATVITDNIESTKKKSFEVSVIHLLDASKEYVAKNMENHDFPSDGIAATTEELEIDNNPFISGTIKRNENGQIVLIDVTDGRYCANGVKSNLEITRGDCSSQDETPPEVKVKVLEVGTTSAKILIRMQDSGSGIKKYTYCLDGQCNEIKKNNEKNILKEVINLNNLKIKTKYELSVEVENSLEDEKINKTKKNIEFETKEIEKPEFKISTTTYATVKELTIIYPKVEEGYKYKYKISDNEEAIEVTEKEIKLEIKEYTKVIAYVEKDGEVIVENSIIVDGIDNNAPTVNVTITDIDKWTTNKTVTINADDKEIGLAIRPYSFDGGKTWAKEANKIYTTAAILNIKVRDRLGNISNSFMLNGTECTEKNPCAINNIDSIGPAIKYEIIEGTKETEENEWYTSEKVIVKVTIFDQVKVIDEQGVEKIVEGGVGVNQETINISSDNKNASINKKSNSEYMITMNENGIYNISLDAEDLLGNKSNDSSRITIKKDTGVPSISSKKSSNDYLKKDGNKKISEYFKYTYSVSGGNIVCKDIKTGTEVTTLNNIYNLGKSTRQVECTAIGNNGRSASAKTSFRNYYAAIKHQTGSYDCNCTNYSCNCKDNQTCTTQKVCASKYDCNCKYECWQEPDRSGNNYTYTCGNKCDECCNYQDKKTCTTQQVCQTCTKCETCYNYEYLCDYGGTKKNNNCYY